MKIIINDHRKVFAIQEEFSSLFSNLGIEFFAKPSKAGSTPSKKLVKHGSNKLLECRATHKKGVIEIFPSMTIHELKENFSDVFGLTVEIVRKSGNDKNPLPVREKLTLEEGNKPGTEVTS